jgi:hypothetical protein
MRTLIGFLLSASVSYGGGFSKGSNFNFRHLQGEVEMNCSNRQSITLCREQFLEPWPYDFFVGPKIPSANRILFESKINSSQEIRSVEAGYFGTLGRSEEINLGISSIFQSPLLKLGLNQIRYKILNRSRETLFEGEFFITVVRLSPKTCNQKIMTAINSEDCELTYSVCQQYFNELNYCQPSKN